MGRSLFRSVTRLLGSRLERSSQQASAIDYGIWRWITETRSEFGSAVSEGVEVTLVQVDPDDAIAGCEVLDLMERAPKLEHPRRRVEVGPIRVRLRENRSALSDVMDRSVIDRIDERVRPVAP